MRSWRWWPNECLKSELRCLSGGAVSLGCFVFLGFRLSAQKCINRKFISGISRSITSCFSLFWSWLLPAKACLAYAHHLTERKLYYRVAQALIRPHLSPGCTVLEEMEPTEAQRYLPCWWFEASVPRMYSVAMEFLFAGYGGPCKRSPKGNATFWMPQRPWIVFFLGFFGQRSQSCIGGFSSGRCYPPLPMGSISSNVHDREF